MTDSLRRVQARPATLRNELPVRGRVVKEANIQLDSP